MNPEFVDGMRLIRAAQKDASCSELQDDSGRRILVERDPEPGIAIRLTRHGAEDTSHWQALRVRPVEQRPASYPTSLPFLPTRSAAIVSSSGGTTATWRLVEAPACGFMPGLKDSPTVARMREALEPIADRVRAGDKAARAELGARMREFTAALSPSDRAALYAAARPDAESLAELTQVFDAARESSIADGWTVVEEQRTDSPVPGRTASFEKGGEERRLVMVATSGPGAVVFLDQQAKEAAGRADGE